MRNAVYTKFAEALDRQIYERAAADRYNTVHTKFAEAIGHIQMQKSAAVNPKKLLTALASAYKKLSPEIKLKGKFDPRRLISSTKRISTSAINGSPFTASELRAAAKGGKAYSYGGSGNIKTYDELDNLGGIKEVTKLSPAKILAALGITGGTVAAAKTKGSAGASVPAIGDAVSPNSSLVSRLMANKRLVAALGGAGLLAGGSGTYAAVAGGTTGKKKSKDAE